MTDLAGPGPPSSLTVTPGPVGPGPLVTMIALDTDSDMSIPARSHHSDYGSLSLSLRRRGAAGRPRARPVQVAAARCGGLGGARSSRSPVQVGCHVGMLNGGQYSIFFLPSLLSRIWPHCLHSLSSPTVCPHSLVPLCALPLPALLCVHSKGLYALSRGQGTRGHSIRSPSLCPHSRARLCATGLCGPLLSQI